MNKPIKRKDGNYDYVECDAYISELLGRDINNFFGTTYLPPNGKPYKSFWQTLTTYGIKNKSYFRLIKCDGLENWEKEISDSFFEEFGDGSKKLDFFVDWKDERIDIINEDTNLIKIYNKNKKGDL